MRELTTNEILEDLGVTRKQAEEALEEALKPIAKDFHLIPLDANAKLDDFCQAIHLSLSQQNSDERKRRIVAFIKKEDAGWGWGIAEKFCVCISAVGLMLGVKPPEDLGIGVKMVSSVMLVVGLAGGIIGSCKRGHAQDKRKNTKELLSVIFRGYLQSHHSLHGEASSEEIVEDFVHVWPHHH